MRQAKVSNLEDRCVARHMNKQVTTLDITTTKQTIRVTSPPYWLSNILYNALSVQVGQPLQDLRGVTTTQTLRKTLGLMVSTSQRHIAPAFVYRYILVEGIQVIPKGPPSCSNGNVSHHKQALNCTTKLQEQPQMFSTSLNANISNDIWMMKPLQLFHRALQLLSSSFINPTSVATNAHFLDGHV